MAASINRGFCLRVFVLITSALLFEFQIVALDFGKLPCVCVCVCVRAASYEVPGSATRCMLLALFRELNLLGL